MKLIPLIMMLAYSAYSGEEAYRKDKIASGKEGHGGDSVLCAASKKNSYNGLYVLDYIISKERNPKNLRGLGADKEMKVIHEELERKIPQLNESFKEFMKAYSVAHSQKRTAKHYWQSEPNGLYEIHDENLKAKLPENCQKIIQTVTWSKRNEQFLYRYDPGLLSELVKNGQLSWINVHEWLRGYMTDADAIRDVNEYFHSVDFVNDDEHETVKTLSILQMGSFKTTTVHNLEQSLITRFTAMITQARALLKGPCTETEIDTIVKTRHSMMDLVQSDDFHKLKYVTDEIDRLRDDINDLQYALENRARQCLEEIESAKMAFESAKQMLEFKRIMQDRK
jgi:hypothetical protein